LGNMHHHMLPSKTRWPSLNTAIFRPVMHLVLDDPKQWPPICGQGVAFNTHSYLAPGLRKE
jgi:hypothetical protein